MRIISGKYKGARLFSPVDDRVRPTTDRIKESVFNIITSRMRLSEATVLDLFAGSGALGLEACSRGAGKVVFVDHDKDSIKLVKDNIAKIRLPDAQYEIYFTEYATALKKLAGRNFDLIFLDPPYASDAAEKALALIEKYNLLSDGGIVVVEHDKDKTFDSGSFLSDCRRMGNTSVSFLTKGDNE